MPLHIDLPIQGAAMPIELRAGLSTIIVGANGSGKTKLAMGCEEHLGTRVHRISAQRMLAFDPSIAKINEGAARNQLRYGNDNQMTFGTPIATRNVNRWGQNGPQFILNDAGPLLQVLLAEQANVAVKAFNASLDGIQVVSGETLIRKLKAIFHRVLPTRRLERHLTGVNR